ncbi:amidohydrolase [Sporosarcina obsidiansis]|uniref:amidohydrolase n=1 Tax=Sporosarcina obsidiansis TaxID=2660748 RepID=UPI00129AF56F|nr:amidohydrolase [Sporosarcina obsidiansis]
MFAIKNAMILDGKGNTIQNGTILIKNGKIEEVVEGTLEIPSSFRVLDVDGSIVTPGLIDVHTHLGIEEMETGGEGEDLNEETNPITPELRVIDGIHMSDPAIEDARKAGVTTVQILPGSSNIIGGEMAVIKLRKDIVVDRCILKAPSGMKAALGENPKMTYGSKGRAPMTRMKIAAMLRQALIDAKEYQKQVAKGETPRHIDKENLVKVLTKEIPLRVHAHRVDDIVTVLRIKEEFDIDVTIEHCTEGHLIADYISESDVMVSVGPTMSPKSKIELKNKSWETPKTLVDANILIALTTDHSVVGIDHLITTGIIAMKNGISEQQALQAITYNSAVYMGVEDRVGSLEKGKDADLVIWSGDIFDLRSSVTHTMIDGEFVFMKDNLTIAE